MNLCYNYFFRVNLDFGYFFFLNVKNLGEIFYNLDNFKSYRWIFINIMILNFNRGID